MVLVSDVMTQDPVSLWEEVSVDVAIDLIVEKNISGVPIVDRHKVLVGLITEYDVLQFYGTHDDDEATRRLACRDIMVTDIRTIPQDATLEVAAKIFKAASLRRLLVVDGNNFVGILSRRDVVRSIRDGRLTVAT